MGLRYEKTRELVTLFVLAAYFFENSQIRTANIIKFAY